MEIMEFYTSTSKNGAKMTHKSSSVLECFSGTPGHAAPHSQQIPLVHILSINKFDQNFREVFLKKFFFGDFDIGLNDSDDKTYSL